MIAINLIPDTEQKKKTQTKTKQSLSAIHINHTILN